MIRCVIFDIDGTLYDYQRANAAGMKAIQTYCTAEFGWSEARFEAAHKAAYDGQYEAAKGTASSHSRLIRYGRMMESEQLPLTHALMLDELYWSAMLEGAECYVGLKQALEELREAGYRLGIGTNMTAYPQYCKLRKLGILSDFDFLVTSEEALAEKPAAGLFERCVAYARCEADECLYIGDEVKKDVQGAENAGLNALLYDPEGTRHSAGDLPSEKVFEHYEKLPSLIRKMRQ